MKRKSTRPSRNTSKSDEFKYSQSSSNKVSEIKEKESSSNTSLPDDDDYNSGFGSYLRSAEGIFYSLKLN